MKISRLEKLTLAVTALVLAFLAGWFLSRQAQIQQVFVPSASLELPASPSPSPTAEAPGRVNINTADAEVLATLPGIGPKRASAIVAYREENGPFPVVEALTDVPGIGEATLEGCIDLITVQQEAQHGKDTGH